MGQNEQFFDQKIQKSLELSMDFSNEMKLNSRLPCCSRSSHQWGLDITKQVNLLKHTIDSCCPRTSFEELSAQLNMYMQNLRMPTVQEMIHENVTQMQQVLLDGSSESFDQKTVRLVNERGEPLNTSSEKKPRLYLVDRLNPIPWTEEKLLIQTRLTVPLESYKLSNDFSDCRFKRHFASYNFKPDAHINSRRHLQHLKAQKTQHIESSKKQSPGEDAVDSLSGTKGSCRKAVVPQWIMPVPAGGNLSELFKNDRVSLKNLVPCSVIPVQHGRKNLTCGDVSTPYVSCPPTLSLQPQSSSGEDQSWNEVPNQTVLVTIAFYHSLRGFKLAEFDVPDYFTLAQVKDKFFCEEDCYAYAQGCKTSFFYINGIFYYDCHQSDVPVFFRRLSNHIHSTQSKEAHQDDLWHPMEKIALNQLDIPFNLRCAYMHSGDCEHRVTFTSMRWFLPQSDVPYEKAYPLLVYQPTTRITQCQACLVDAAKKTVVNSSRLPQSAVQLCMDCFDHFFFDENGECVTKEDFIHFDCHDGISSLVEESR